MEEEEIAVLPIKFFSEFLGTFFVASGITTSVKVDDQGNHSCDIFKLSICIFVSIFTASKIGGAYFNPAVLYLKYLNNKNQKEFIQRNFLTYTIIECLASVCGFLVFYYINDKIVFRLKINETIPTSYAFFVEIFCSFILYLILTLQDDSDYSFNAVPIYSIINSVAGIITGIAIGGNISGAGMNPAIAFGANFVRFLVTGNLVEVKYLWIYIIAPFIAAKLSSLFYLNVLKLNKDNKNLVF